MNKSRRQKEACFPNKYNRAKEKQTARRLADAVSEVVITSRAIIRQTPFVPAIEGADEEEDAIYFLSAG